MAGKLTVWFIDECHLLWGDMLGYVWGKQSERLEVPITNERERVTYYGALNYWLSSDLCYYCIIHEHFERNQS